MLMISQFKILSIKVVKSIELCLSFFVSAHLIDFTDVGKNDLSPYRSIRLVSLVAISHIRLVICVDVLEDVFVIILLLHAVEPFGVEEAKDKSHGDPVSMIQQGESLG